MSGHDWTDGTWDKNGLSVTAFGRGTIANCPTPQSAGTFECQANARLIAAAPELFEALTSIQWKSADKDNMEFAARITYSQMDAIRAALAKATGATP